jgi:hypothetical protein
LSTDNITKPDTHPRRTPDYLEKKIVLSRLSVCLLFLFLKLVQLNAQQKNFSKTKSSTFIYKPLESWRNYWRGYSRVPKSMSLHLKIKQTVKIFILNAILNK